MAKATTKKASTNKVSNAKKKDLIDPKAYQFLKEYINNPSPVGFESSGQKISNLPDHRIIERLFLLNHDPNTNQFQSLDQKHLFLHLIYVFSK